MTSGDAASRSRGAPSAGEALALLQLIARHAGPSPAATLARELDLPLSTTYKLLGVLRDAGFVSHDPTTRRWGLGPAAHELGSAYRRQTPLQRAAQGIVTELARHTGACAHLVVLHGQDVLYVLEERPLGVPPLVTDVGVRLPATVTASGLAILAALPNAQVRALVPRSEDLVQRQDAGAAPTTLSALRSELARVRARLRLGEGLGDAGFRLGRLRRPRSQRSAGGQHRGHLGHPHPALGEPAARGRWTSYRHTSWRPA